MDKSLTSRSIAFLRLIKEQTLSEVKIVFGVLRKELFSFPDLFTILLVTY